MENAELYLNLKRLLEQAVHILYPGIENFCPEVELDTPRDLSHGDLFSNIAFKIAKVTKKDLTDTGGKICQEIETHLGKDAMLSRCIKKVKLIPPGFINFFFSEAYLSQTLAQINREDVAFGAFNLGQGEKVQVEFVSANPTGPLSIAHGRQAAIGDALANIFSFLGYRVNREYYINDEGLQIENLGRSVWVRFRQQFGEEHQLPPDGYRGTYIIDLAKKIPAEFKDKYTSWDEAAKGFFIGFGCQEILKIIKQDLESFGVKFDTWVSQADLIKSEKVKQAISLLKKKDFIYEKEGATWLKSSLLGDDKDRVVVKSDGSLTYIASDIAYHKDKYEQGFKKIINIWGPDHHGYILRLRAAVKALGYDDMRLKILIVQLATLYRDGKPVAMSTRAGSFITLEEVIAEVGKDVARFFFLKRRLDSHLDFDLTVAKQESLENPVYYIQYAHARISSLLNYARDNRIDIQDIARDETITASYFKYLDKPEEINIVRMLQQFPFVLIAVCEQLEPNVLISYLETIAKSFHKYYAQYRIVSPESSLTRARIFMALATGVVLRNGLRLLGVAFPEKM
jgi:arginyl-tRNA synthetase